MLANSVKLLVLILMFAIAFPVVSYGQDSRSTVTIKGQVLNKADSTPVQFMYIINLNTKMGTVTASDGSFSISGSLNDSMRFSSVGYKDHYLTLNENMIKNGLTYYIGKTTYELEPVIIRPYKVTPFNTPRSIVLDKPVKQPKPQDLGNTPAPPRDIFSIGWDPVLNNIRRQTEEINRWKARDYLNELVHKRYNKDFVGRLTGLADDEAETFMTYCDLPNEYVLATTDYDLAVTIKQYYAAYQRHPKKNTTNEFRP